MTSPPRPGPHDAVTDVEGVRVGHATRDEPGWLTGCTVVVPPVGTVGGVDVRGGAPGTRETDLLDPRCLVDAVDAVVLGGGSAFGLATADGVVDGLYAAGRGWALGDPGQVVPIVPAAILFDLGRGGAWQHHPGSGDGAAALAAAADGPVEVGAVGAGTGTRAGGLRGGVGTASLVLASGHTVSALVAVNSVGSPLATDGTLLGARLLPADEAAALPTPDPVSARAYWAAVAEEREQVRAGTATTIGVVVTDAALSKAQCHKLAGVSHDGLARALSPVHTAYDGDTVFALATGARPEPAPLDLLDLHAAAADCVARAIVRAVVAGVTVDRTEDGGVRLPSWRDALCRKASG